MPARRSEVSQDAREDLALQYTWYMNQAGSSIAERYLSAFEQSVRALTLQPEMGMPRRFRDRRLSGIRSIQMHGAFRVHLLFYRIEEDVLVIFRVLHGMRDLPRRLITPPESE